jgi:tetratricopeptide (TPR) repeat protein
MLKDVILRAAAVVRRRFALRQVRPAGTWDALGARHDPARSATAAATHAAASQACHAAEADARRGDLEGGITRLEAWISVEPNHAAARVLLGSLYRKSARLDAAASQLAAALALQPSSTRGWNELGIVNLERGKAFDARQCFARALSLDPDLAEAHCNLGIIALDEGNFANAIKSLRHALQLDPSLWAAHCNLGLALYGAGEFLEAERVLASALKRDPGNALLCLHASFALLARGEWREGWQRFEARLELPDSPIRFTYPRWRGEPLVGKRLLVSGEQGLGDQIMFLSCLPDAVSRGAKCALSMDRRLDGLLRRSFPEAEIVHDNEPGQGASFDFQVAAGSLPRWFRNANKDFPQRGAYLVADPQRVAHWRRRLEALGDGLKIGISWRGGTLATRRMLRSVELETLTIPLSALSPHLISLQYTDCAAELNALRANHGLAVQHWVDALSDYDETAALVCALDCVVSVCTSIVHLGGALGRPVWVLAPSSPEWRYGREGERIPWYPTVRIHRQAVQESWQPVVAGIAQDIRRVAATSAVARN